MILFFFFKQKTAYEMRISDWSSDVCSSDLPAQFDQAGGPHIVEPGIAALRLDDRIIIAAISDVDGKRADALDLDLDIARGDIGGNIDDADRRHLVAIGVIGDVDDPPRNLDLQPAGRRRQGEAMFESEGDDPDRAVTKIGRASGRERGCQDVSNSVVAVSLKKKKKISNKK